MKIFQALHNSKEELGNFNLSLNLMSYHLNISKEQVFLNSNLELKDDAEFFNLVKRYVNGEPFHYITGVCDFLGREFEVGKGVLIPRFETELLVERVLDISKEFSKPNICEIGIGSGIISVSLALDIKDANIVATDISDTALSFAKKNINKFGVDIKLIKTNLLDNVNDNFDIIVSNPPYISMDYKLDKWVMNEPKIALIGGKKGDEILKDIINLAKSKTKFLACEIGYDEKYSLSKELDKYGFEYEFYKDLAGFDRGFVAKNKFKG